MNGKTIDHAESSAGMVEIFADDTRILLNDGTNIRFFPAGVKLPEKHQLLVVFEDDSALVCSIQMYGGIWAFQAGENDNPYYLTAKEKPSPLGDVFDQDYFQSLLTEQTGRLSAKAFLATEQRIPGLGNGVLQDILFNAHVHPKRKMLTLKDAELDDLFFSVKNTLADMTLKGGRDTEKDLFGHAGGYRTILSKNTVGRPCPKCKTPICKEAYLGGSIYLCEFCQR